MLLILRKRCSTHAEHGDEILRLDCRIYHLGKIITEMRGADFIFFELI